MYRIYSLAQLQLCSIASILLIFATYGTVGFWQFLNNGTCCSPEVGFTTSFSPSVRSFQPWNEVSHTDKKFHAQLIRCKQCSFVLGYKIPFLCTKTLNG
jgi:hypothetical protein